MSVCGSCWRDTANILFTLYSFHSPRVRTLVDARRVASVGACVCFFFISAAALRAARSTMTASCMAIKCASPPQYALSMSRLVDSSTLSPLR